MVAHTVVATLFAVAVLGLVFLCGVALSRRALRAGPVVALAGGALVVGLTGLVAFYTTWLAPDVAPALLVAVVACLVVITVATTARTIRGGALRSAVPLLLSAAGVSAFSLGVLLLRASADEGFNESAGRFGTQPLPVDNRIPSLLATYLADGTTDQFLIGDWLPSDRPGLQSGLILVVRALAPALGGLPGGGPSLVDIDFGASVTAQLLWVPAVLALLLALGFRRRTAIAAVAMTAIVPVIFINTVFTWPKLLAAAFVVSSLAILVGELRKTTPSPFALTMAAACGTLGLLSHGATAFLLPALVAGAVLLLRRMTLRSALASAGAAAGAGVILYLPWLVFQRVAHPPGDRLLKWHLAGQVPLDDRTFPQTLLDEYGRSGWAELIDARLANFGRAFDLLVARDLDVWNVGWQERRIEAEFYSTPPALGVAAVVLVAMIVAAVLARVRVGRIRDDTLRLSTGLCAAMIGCILLWSLVMFSPGSAIVHQGSHAWMVVLIAVPCAWLVRAAPRVAVGAAALQATLSALVYQNSLVRPDEPILRSMIALTLVGCALMVGSIISTRLSRGDDPDLYAAETESSPPRHLDGEDPGVPELLRGHPGAGAGHGRMTP